MRPPTQRPPSKTTNSGGSRISRRGGVDLIEGGGMDSRGGYVSKNLYVKIKESGPVPGTPPSRSANGQR